MDTKKAQKYYILIARVGFNKAAECQRFQPSLLELKQCFNHQVQAWWRL